MTRKRKPRQFFLRRNLVTCHCPSLAIALSYQFAARLVRLPTAWLWLLRANLTLAPGTNARPYVK